MKHFLFAVLASIGLLALAPSAGAVTCANGVYRAGCAGPNGAAVVRKQYPQSGAYYHPHYYRPGAPVNCAAGAYRAGCVGPNGAVVHRRYY